MYFLQRFDFCEYFGADRAYQRIAQQAMKRDLTSWMWRVYGLTCKLSIRLTSVYNLMAYYYRQPNGICNSSGCRWVSFLYALYRSQDAINCSTTIKEPIITDNQLRRYRRLSAC